LLACFLSKNVADGREKIDGTGCFNSKNCCEVFQSDICVIVKDKVSDSKMERAVKFLLPSTNMALE